MRSIYEDVVLSMYKLDECCSIVTKSQLTWNPVDTPRHLSFGTPAGDTALQVGQCHYKVAGTRTLDSTNRNLIGTSGLSKNPTISNGH